MNPKIYFGGHTDAGFFVHAVNRYYGGILHNGERHAISASDITGVSDDELVNNEKFNLIIPVLDEWRLESADSIHSILRPSVVRAINEDCCRLIFDFSNEAGSVIMLARLSQILSQCGVDKPSKAWLICQNRLLRNGDSNQVQPVIFDFFLLAGIAASASNLSRGTEARLVSAIEENNKPYSITCLNATPRAHRIHAILEIIDQGLIDPASLNHRVDIALPYISLPSLHDTKGDPLTAEALYGYLSSLGIEHLAKHLEWLIQSLPLKADSFSEKGNQLATKVATEHYMKSKLSIVTETGVDNGIERITEKTIKPLAHGHPFIVVGHQRSVRIIRNLGFSAMDDFIDHSYDLIEDPSARIRAAVMSAKSFLRRSLSDDFPSMEISAHARHNIMWAKQGFKEFYWNHYVSSILAIFNPLGFIL